MVSRGWPTSALVVRDYSIQSPFWIPPYRDSLGGFSGYEIEGAVHVLQSLHADGWFDLYAFTQEPQCHIDYVVANHFTSTYPHSPFVQTLVVQRQNSETRITLRNRELIEESANQTNTRILPDDDAVLATLTEVFGLTFPAGTRFRYQE